MDTNQILWQLILVFTCVISEVLFGLRTEKRWRIKAPCLGNHVYFDRLLYE
jgi:hypothetical protein